MHDVDIREQQCEERAPANHIAVVPGGDKAGTFCPADLMSLRWALDIAGGELFKRR